MVSTVRTRDRSGGEEGVYYRHEDYAGFWRRLVVDLIDVVVVLLLFFACGLVAWLADPGEELPTDALLVFVLAGLSYGYFVLLKGSPLRTLGYRIGRVRVVNLQGEPPGLFSLTIRFLFSVLGPLNFGLDLIWIPSDKSRQALRDRSPTRTSSGLTRSPPAVARYSTPRTTSSERPSCFKRSHRAGSRRPPDRAPEPPAGGKRGKSERRASPGAADSADVPASWQSPPSGRRAAREGVV